jgi:hypothetical protein
MSRYALQGETSKELLTYGGRVLVHDNPTELEFLIAGARVVAVPRDIPPDQTMPVRYHPSLVSVRWPLRREDFTS